jgi:hypothetical protein
MDSGVSQAGLWFRGLRVSRTCQFARLRARYNWSDPTSTGQMQQISKDDGDMRRYREVKVPGARC